MIESAFISNNYSFFNRELIRRKYWIKNKRDVEFAFTKNKKKEKIF